MCHSFRCDVMQRPPRDDAELTRRTDARVWFVIAKRREDKATTGFPAPRTIEICGDRDTMLRYTLGFAVRVPDTGAEQAVFAMYWYVQRCCMYTKCLC